MRAQSIRYWAGGAIFLFLYVIVEVLSRKIDQFGFWPSALARILLLTLLVAVQVSMFEKGHLRQLLIVVIVALIGAGAAELLLMYLLDWGDFQPSFPLTLVTHVDTCLEGSALAVLVLYVVQGLRRRRLH